MICTSCGQNYINCHCKKLLSILIISHKNRKELLDRLIDQLQGQIQGNPVEIRTLINSGEGTRGRFRQQLLEEATGEYIAFIDDDDTVADDYVNEIISGLQARADVIGLKGFVTSLNNNVRRNFILSKNYTMPFSLASKDYVNNTYYRTVSHLNPVKRSLALKAGFRDENIRGDNNYSIKLLPLLKTENLIDKPLYYYWYRMPL